MSLEVPVIGHKLNYNHKVLTIYSTELFDCVSTCIQHPRKPSTLWNNISFFQARGSSGRNMALTCYSCYKPISWMQNRKSNYGSVTNNNMLIYNNKVLQEFSFKFIWVESWSFFLVSPRSTQVEFERQGSMVSDIWRNDNTGTYS